MAIKCRVDAATGVRDEHGVHVLRHCTDLLSRRAIVRPSIWPRFSIMYVPPCMSRYILEASEKMGHGWPSSAIFHM